MRAVIDMEREGDTIRREIISNIYEGAFLPYLRKVSSGIFLGWSLGANDSCKYLRNRCRYRDR